MCIVISSVLSQSSMNMSTEQIQRRPGRPRLGNQQISFQLPREMIKKLKEMAAEQGIKTSTLVQRILREAL
jgi:predicted DNA binding CopG/RHH family protein